MRRATLALLVLGCGDPDTVYTPDQLAGIIYRSDIACEAGPCPWPAGWDNTDPTVLPACMGGTCVMRCGRTRDARGFLCGRCAPACVGICTADHHCT